MKKLHKIGTFLTGILFVLLLLYCGRITHLAKIKANIGEQAVRLLYNFGTVEQLDAQMPELKKITTKAVYDQLTIDNESRTLNTYLKFKNEATAVHTLRKTDTYILYSLDNPYIDQQRTFIFRFEVGVGGTIYYVREAEQIDFLDYVD